MSFGTKDSTSQNQSQSSSYYDPTQVGLIDQYVSTAPDVQASLGYTPYTGPGLSFGDGGTLSSLEGYTAPTVGGSSYAASTIAPGAVPTVSAGLLSDTDLSPYLNPYASDVADTTADELARQNDIANTNAAGQATQAGAFGGSRSAVLQNLNTDSYQRNLDQTLAGLNQSNFTNAQQAAETDLARQLTAGQDNQQTGLSVAQDNQSALNQAAQFGAGQAQSAAVANQGAAQSAAQTQLSALSQAEQQANALYGADWQQYTNSQTAPIAVQQLINQMYGLVPQSPLNQSTSEGNTDSFGVDFTTPK